MKISTTTFSATRTHLYFTDEEVLKILQYNIPIREICFRPYDSQIEFFTTIPEASYQNITIHDLDYNFIIKNPRQLILDYIVDFTEARDGLINYLKTSPKLENEPGRIKKIIENSPKLMALILGAKDDETQI